MVRYERSSVSLCACCKRRPDDPEPVQWAAAAGFLDPVYDRPYKYVPHLIEGLCTPCALRLTDEAADPEMIPEWPTSTYIEDIAGDWQQPIFLINTLSAAKDELLASRGRETVWLIAFPEGLTGGPLGEWIATALLENGVAQCR